MTITAAQLIEALQKVPCGAEIYLFCGDKGGHLKTVNLDTTTNITPGQQPMQVIHVALSTDPSPKPQHGGNPLWN